MTKEGRDRMSKSWYSRSQDIEYKDGHIGKEYHLVFETTDKGLARRIEKTFQNIMDGIELEPHWNNHTVACLLADVYGDPCACNYNDISEWLPEKCEVIDACPNPVGVACWEQFLKHREGQDGQTD